MLTVALLLQQEVSTRVLLQTEVLDTLLAGKVRLVILTSDAEALRLYLRNRGFSQVPVEQVDVECYRAHAAGRFGAVLRMMRSFAVDGRTSDDIFAMQWKDARRRAKLVALSLLAFTKALSYLMRWSAVAMKFFVELENRVDAPSAHSEFFEKYRPAALVVTSLGTFNYDHYVMREARRHGVKVISYVLSWDNPTVRGLGTNLSSLVIAWSEIMKEELATLHRIPAEKIVIAGVPHYDYYVNGKRPILSKKELGELFGIDPQKHFLFLGTKSPNGYLYNVDIAQVICRAIIEGRLHRDCCLIARLHPIYLRKRHGELVFHKELSEWKDLSARFGAGCLYVDYPKMLEGSSNLIMADDEIAKLVSILKHSDVVINMFSTLNVEASILDKPTVNVAFQFDHRRPPGMKIERFNIGYDEVQTHNQRIIKSNGTMVARSVEQLIEQINSSLQNPGLHAAGRQRIMSDECGPNLGSAGQKVGQEILTFLERDC